MAKPFSFISSTMFCQLMSEISTIYIFILGKPPSTNTSVPCINEASSDARKVTTFATSDG